MALKLADVFVALGVDASKLEAGFGDAETKTKSFASKASGLLGGALVAGAAAAGAAVIGVGKAAISAETDFDNALDAIINATGASGDQLTAMGESVKNLRASAAGLGVTMEDIGTVIGEVNTRTGLTGEELESLTDDILNFSRLTGADAVQATALLTRAMGDWGVENENAAELLDSIYGAGQAFGISIDSMAGKLVQFGAPLRQMGFGLEESIAMLGKWEKEGVNTELVIGSLRIAAGNFARDNIPLRDGLNETMEAIKGAASESEGLAIAMDVFGARAGPDMAAAIREGRFELDEAIATLQGTQGGLADAATRTMDFREEWQIAMASLQTELIPLGEAIAELAQVVMPYLVAGIGAVVKAVTPWIEGFASLIKYIAAVVEDGDTMNDWLTHLPGPIAMVVRAVAEFITRLGSLSEGMQIWGDKFGFIRKRIDEIMPYVQTLVGNVLCAMQRFWEEHGETIMLVVGNTFQVVGTIIQTTLDMLLQTVKLFLQILTGDWEGAGNTLKSIVQTLWDGIKQIFRLELDSLRAIFADIDWAEIGRSMIRGIGNGIESMGSWLEEKARNAAKRAYDAAKGWLGIDSPSKKAKEGIGVPFVQGIEEGIRTSLGELQYGIDLGLGGLFNSLQPATATAGAPISIVVNVAGDSGTGQAARSGVLSALRQAGLA